MLYTPYIDWAMEYIQKIYSWNQRVDEMRKDAKKKDNDNTASKLLDSVETYILENNVIRSLWVISWYNFNNWLKMYYEEKNEYTEAKLSWDIEEQVDALIDQFIVAIWEIRKCSLADDYQHIEFWEDEANNAYWRIDSVCFDIAEKRFASDEPIAYTDISSLWDSIMNQAIKEVLDALFTRFWDDAYIDASWKFIKSKSYRKPDLSFLIKNEN